MGPSQALRAVVFGFCCTALVLGDLRIDGLSQELSKDRKLLQARILVDLSSIASGLTSGLQGLQQPSTLQSQLSNAGSVINSALSGVLNVGGQGSSQVGQLLNTAQQVAGQLPGISNLQSTGTQIVSSALNSILPQLMGSFHKGQGQGQALQRALQLPPAGAPPPGMAQALQNALQLPAAGASLPSFANVLQSALQLPAAGTSASGIAQLLSTAFPLLGRTPPATQTSGAEKKSPEAANAATDIPRGQPSSRLLPNTAEAATGAPSFPGQFAGLVFTPGMALGHGMGPKMAPAPAPMVAPAPAPQQMLNISFSNNGALAPAPQQMLNISFSYNMTTAAQQAMSLAANFAESFNVTTLGGASASVAINDTQQFLQELQLLASPLANASDYLQALKSGQSAFDESCAKETVQLPKKEPPSCAGKSFQLTLVPWDCVLDDDTNILSCSPAYLTLTKYPDSCTLLDYSEGTLAGKECGLVKRFGIPKKEVFGGQKFDLKALDALIGLEKAAGGSVDGPLATVAIAAAPLDNLPSSITSMVTTFLGG